MNMLLLLFSLQSMAELPVVPPSPDWCVQVASSHYQVPVDLVRAVLKTENGCGKVVRNTNGSFDMGCMQINSIHLAELQGYGFTKDMLVHNVRCSNVIIGTWMLKKLIKDAKTPEQWWVAVGSYNSTPTKKNKGVYNRRYQLWVWKNLRRLQMSSAPIFDAKVDNTKTAEVNHGNTN